MGAFTGFEEVIIELEVYNNLLITELPSGLLRGLVNARIIDITYNSISNLNFLEG